MDQLVHGEANAKKGKAIWGAGLGGDPVNISLAREDNRSLPSKALSIARVDLYSGAAPPALEEVAFSRDAEEQGGEPAHGAALCLPCCFPLANSRIYSVCGSLALAVFLVVLGVWRCFKGSQLYSLSK